MLRLLLRLMLPSFSFPQVTAPNESDRCLLKDNAIRLFHFCVTNAKKMELQQQAMLR